MVFGGNLLDEQSQKWQNLSLVIQREIGWWICSPTQSCPNVFNPFLGLWTLRIGFFVLLRSVTKEAGILTANTVSSASSWLPNWI